MTLEEAILISLATAGIYMTAVYILSLIKRDTSIVDVAWGMGFFTVGLVLALTRDGQSDVFSLVHLLVAIWGARLFVHILLRKAGQPEDWRYVKMRESWGRNHWWRSYLQVFVLQGILMVVISAPLIVSAAATEMDLEAFMALGIAIWVIGFFFETVGDYQLSQFIRSKQLAAATKPKKGAKKQPKFMTTGLWRYTRHPNYFGEVAQWWGLWLIVVQLDYGWAAVVSPLMITFLLLKVSGIPMLERKWEDDKEFQKYKKKTNAFFPGPPKRT